MVCRNNRKEESGLVMFVRNALVVIIFAKSARNGSISSGCEGCITKEYTSSEQMEEENKWSRFQGSPGKWPLKQCACVCVSVCMFVHTAKFFHLQNKNSDFCAPLTSFDWNEVDPNLLGTSSIDTTCTVWGLEVYSSLCCYTVRRRKLYFVSQKLGDLGKCRPIFIMLPLPVFQGI